MMRSAAPNTSGKRRFSATTAPATARAITAISASSTGIGRSLAAPAVLYTPPRPGRPFSPGGGRGLALALLACFRAFPSFGPAGGPPPPPPWLPPPPPPPPCDEPLALPPEPCTSA